MSKKKQTKKGEEGTKTTESSDDTDSRNQETSYLDWETITEEEGEKDERRVDIRLPGDSYEGYY